MDVGTQIGNDPTIRPCACMCRSHKRRGAQQALSVPDFCLGFEIISTTLGLEFDHNTNFLRQFVKWQGLVGRGKRTFANYMWMQWLLAHRTASLDPIATDIRLPQLTALTVPGRWYVRHWAQGWLCLCFRAVICQPA